MSKTVVSIGKIQGLSIPEHLPYAGALRQLVKDATGTGVTLNPETFFSEETTELHNFVSSIRYRFLQINGEPALAYEVSDRPHCVYRELRYDGSVIDQSAWDAETGSFLPEEKEAAQAARRRQVLG
ncbi:hypothetical protein [Tahibacter harae]|uniref:Uncharacterized protein n=1 Tax=Tahibacter harae TaxID=2963937 RepID=A0ABT1QVQ6_9GAMM|nr:hypothetical protein [Tahibacter harae]MCQ4166371.1 hypothetical protein [Tahibacter harae]